MSLLLLVVPLVIANTWHGILLWTARRKGLHTNSISESALMNPQVLAAHRFIHIALAACFIVYSYGSLIEDDLLLATLLTGAVIFDAAQVMTLSERTNHTPFYFRDIHQLTAWLMAALYLVYTVAAAFTAQVSPMWIAAYLSYIALIHASGALTGHRYFWAAQMGFFVSVSTAIVGFTAAI